MIHPLFAGAFLAATTSAASVSLSQRSLVPASVPSGWSYLGCVNDNYVNRTLPYEMTASNSQTGEGCIANCRANGFDIAGTEWSEQCFCGWDESLLVKADETECSMPCTGNLTQVCGGPNMLSVYNAHELPRTYPGDGSTFVYAGCYPDSVQNRVLKTLVASGSDITVQGCAASCRSAGFVSSTDSVAYAGVEYGRECFCGANSILPNAISGSPFSTGCNTVCTGNENQYCGGPNRLNIYTLDPENIAPRQLIVNGDFEDTTDSSWSVESNPQYSNVSQLTYALNTTTAYAQNGTHAFQVSNTGVDGGARSLCISQSVLFPAPGNYLFSSHIGRIASQDGSHGKSVDGIYWQYLLDGLEFKDLDVCNPSQKECNVPAVNGQEVYRLESFPFTVTSPGFHRWAICTLFTGAVDRPDTSLLDNVSIFGPN